MIDLRFHRVELEHARLKEEVAAGRMTEEAFERALDGLTIEAGGRFWALGANSGKWYASDGDRWTEAQPPSIAEPTSVPVQAPPHAVQANPPAGVPPAPPASFAKGVKPQQWILGCGIGCLAPLLLVGGIAQILWARSDYGSTQFGTLAVCFGVFIASMCAVALLRRIPFVVFLGAAILWTVIGHLMRVNGIGYDFFGWFGISIARITGVAAIVGVLLGLAVRKLVPR
jgi:hypothetical protein